MISLQNGLVDFYPLHEVGASGFSMTIHRLRDGVDQAVGIVEYAYHFTAALSQACWQVSDSDFQAGDIDFTICAWVYLDSNGTSMQAVSKDGVGAGQREYILRYDTVGNRFEFDVFRATDSIRAAVANNLGAPSLSTWYFLVGWHDSLANTVNIEANASGAIDSTATGGALQAASNAVFSIGQRGGGTSFWDGRICEVGYWKRVLSQQERAWLYNNGRGRTWPFDGRPDLLPSMRSHLHRVSRAVGPISL